MAKLLTGKEAAAALTAELQGRAAALARRGVTPRLVILRCGTDEADGAYLRGALKRGALCGVDVELRALPENVPPQELLAAIGDINSDASVHGCLLLRPLPSQLRDAEPDGCFRRRCVFGPCRGFRPLHGGGGDGAAGSLRHRLCQETGGGHRALPGGGTARGHAAAGTERHGDGVPHQNRRSARRYP